MDSNHRIIREAPFYCITLDFKPNRRESIDILARLTSCRAVQFVGASLDLSPKKIRALTMQNLYDLMDAITAKADQCVRDGVYFLEGELQQVTSAFMKSVFPQEGRRPYTPPEPETPQRTQGEVKARPLHSWPPAPLKE